MKKKKWSDTALTQEQRQLVQDNIGLVAVHLRRYVVNLSQPRRDREWEDLFQEGCIGLIRSALLFRKESGIPFAAFALPRIHNEVSRALERKFTTVIVPLKRKKRDCRGHDITESYQQKRPKEYSMSANADVMIEDHRHRPDEYPDRKHNQETIGERLRGKYERAVHEAVKRISRRASTRGDRDELLRWITKERFLIPHEESRRALRQIARDTKSSYARVAQCDKQLAQIIRSVLNDDPEFCELQKCRKNDSEGMNRPIDPELELQVRAACCKEYKRRYDQADNDDRAKMLHAAIREVDGDVDGMIDQLFDALTSDKREKLFRRDVTTSSEKKTRKIRRASADTVT